MTTFNLLVALLSVGQPIRDTIPSTDSFESSCIRATDKEQLRDIITEFLYKLDDDALRQLQSSSNDQVALLAAWRKVSRSFVSSKQARRADQSLIHRFLGAIEGRLNESVPTWWEDRWCRIGSFDSRLIVGFGIDPHVLHDAGAGMMANKEITIRKEKLGLRIARHGDDVGLLTNNLTSRLQKQFPQSDRLAVAVVDDEHVVVAFYSALPYSYPMALIKKADGSIVWETTIWCEASMQSIKNSPEPFHRVEIIVRKGQIVVWGAADWSMYLERFGCTNGKSDLRFSTSY